jgi:polyisoprenoid-binding protein YceI
VLSLDEADVTNSRVEATIDAATVNTRNADRDAHLRSRDYRKDFGLVWNAALETGGVLAGEDVTITLDVQFVKA